VCELDFSIARERQRATPSPTKNLQDQQKQYYGPERSQRERSARPERPSGKEAPISNVVDEERDFWEQTFTALSEQAKLELMVFKRVHLQDVSEFTQAMNRIDLQSDIQHTRNVSMTVLSIFHVYWVVDLGIRSKFDAPADCVLCRNFPIRRITSLSALERRYRGAVNTSPFVGTTTITTLRTG
jgi:hypothetical protein